MSTRTPTRPTTHRRPTVPTQVIRPGRAPRSSRSWLLASIAALVVTAAIVAVLLLMAPGADTGSAALSRGDLATIARLEGQATAYEQARQSRAEEAESARWIAQAEQYEQRRQARSNAAYTARLEGLANRELGR